MMQVKCLHWKNKINWLFFNVNCFTYRCDMGSISSTFYVQLLRADPECAKRLSSQQCRLALLGPTGVKAVRRMLMKLTPYHNDRWNHACCQWDWIFVKKQVIQVNPLFKINIFKFISGHLLFCCWSKKCRGCINNFRL